MIIVMIMMVLMIVMGIIPTVIIILKKVISIGELSIITNCQ